MKSTDLAGITALGRVVSQVRKGARVIWEAVRGLFATRMWIEPKYWTENDDDYWLER